MLTVLLIGGLGAALFAGYEVVNPAISQVCSPNPLLSCSKVLASGHTTILGVSDWSIGVAGYSVMLVLALLAFRTFDRRYLKAVTGLSLAGVAIVGYLVYTETVVIGAICLVCTTAHILNFGVLAVSVALLRLGREEEPIRSPPADRAAT